jgi:hypothetical protein
MLVGSADVSCELSVVISLITQRAFLTGFTGYAGCFIHSHSVNYKKHELKSFLSCLPGRSFLSEDWSILSNKEAGVCYELSATRFLSFFL